jgi:hypothetical protein
MNWYNRHQLTDERANERTSVAVPDGTLLALDLDYVHPADPAEPQREPWRVVDPLEAAHDAVCAAFARVGVTPLALLTPAGYRYLLRAPLGSRFHAGLEDAGRGPAWGRPAGSLTVEQRAHRGAGRLLQLVAQRALCDVAPAGAVPVRLADLPPPGGGPFLRLDLSAYAERPEHHHERHAESAGAVIPAVVDGAQWLREYDGSALAAFQREMDGAPESTEQALRGLLDPGSLPPCVAATLHAPCPAPLQPRHLRTIALVLWSAGWHPRAIAALVRSRYEAPYDWGSFWDRHDRAERAEFFVRLFCSAAAEGLEDGGAFRCGAVAQLAPCPDEGCGYDLGRLFRRRRVLQVRNESHA